ncbi:MAG: hypothetical protein IPM79_32335 [Polyangiaceae bacterium]|nr:hypothetical protein [Polyangiaceae bacterium]
MKHRLTWLASLSLSLSLAACGDDTSGVGASGAGGEAGVGGEAAGGGGSTAESCAPSFDGETLHLAVGGDLEAGDEQTLCLRWTAPQALDITRFVGTLGPAAGHHALLLVHPTPSGPDGVAPCSEAELMDAVEVGEFQMLAGISYESDGVPITFPSSPVQIGLRVPEGAQLVLDAHFLNASPEAASTCASIDLVTGEPVVAALEFRTLLPAEQYTMVIPANDGLDVSFDIPVDEDVRVAAASTHMHEGGTHAELVVQPSGYVLHETDEWAEPEPTQHTTTASVIRAGDTLQLSCSFENTTSTDQHFPDQMCVAGMYVLSCGFPGACP